MSKSVTECFNSRLPCKAEVYAVKALADGKADSTQQKLALSYIVKVLCRAHDLHFIPGSQDETAFLAGRGFVGKKIIKLVEVPAGEIAVSDNNQKEAGTNE